MSGSTSAGLGLRQMPRIPLQVLVLPFRQGTDGVIEYAVFRRSDYGDDCWQGLAGGAEGGESAEQAAQRGAMEEAGIPVDAPLIPLDAVASIPATHFRDHHLWDMTCTWSPSEPSVYASMMVW